MLASPECEDGIFPYIPNIHSEAVRCFEGAVDPSRRWEDAGVVIIPQKSYDRLFIGLHRGISVGAIILKS